MSAAQSLLRRLFAAALAAAEPARLVPRALPHIPDRPLTVIGAGKAAAAMARALEQHRQVARGLVVVPYRHGAVCRRVEVVEAGHPVPDAAGVRATDRIVKLVAGLTAADVVVCLLSGGGSSLLVRPLPGITLADKQRITERLLASGASIDEINCVRRHLSAVKGGKLAAACTPASVITLAISDVHGNDPAVIASGPTVSDPSTPAEALAILDHYLIAIPDHVRRHLERTTLPPETPRAAFHTLATSDDALAAAESTAKEVGLATLNLGDLAGDARALAIEHAKLALGVVARDGPVDAPCVVLSGGETTVRVVGDGRGGRNGEYALQLALSLDGHAGIFALACDTDGIDGSGDNAGCIVAPDSLRIARARGIDASVLQSKNDSYAFFSATNGLVTTGPTLTNVNDFRAILIGD